jgi:hypothetical protein
MVAGCEGKIAGSPMNKMDASYSNTYDAVADLEPFIHSTSKEGVGKNSIERVGSPRELRHLDLNPI